MFATLEEAYKGEWGQPAGAPSAAGKRNAPPARQANNAYSTNAYAANANAPRDVARSSPGFGPGFGEPAAMEPNTFGDAFGSTYSPVSSLADDGHGGFANYGAREGFGGRGGGGGYGGADEFGPAPTEDASARGARAVLARVYARKGARGVLDLVPREAMRSLAKAAKKRAKHDRRHHKKGKKGGRGEGKGKKGKKGDWWDRAAAFLKSFVATPERVLLLLLVGLAALVAWDTWHSRRTSLPAAYVDGYGYAGSMGGGGGYGGGFEAPHVRMSPASAGDAGIAGSFGSLPPPSGAFL